VVLAALGVFAALPVAKVYTSGAPWIERIELRTNDLKELHGRGVPGTAVDVYYRQRNFKQGCTSCSEPIETCLVCAALPFEWCSWLNGGNAIFLGSTQVNPLGTWQLLDRDLQVLPGNAAGRTCATGVLTQIELRSQYGDFSVPDVMSVDMVDVTGDAGHQRLGATIEFANQVAVAVADGPNDVQDATAPWTIDTDEDGVDLCESGLGCGALVRWRLAGGGTFQPPSIEVRDDSPIVGPRDQEFGHVMGMIQGHKPGGSVLAAAYVSRPTPVGPALNVNVDIKADIGLGCSSSGGYFDFLP
jgi:hypothetical protein